MQPQNYVENVRYDNVFRFKGRRTDFGRRALVTGGAGFVGSHLCEALLTLGYDVTCVDNLSTGRKENIDHLVGSPSFRFLNHDVRQPLDLHVDTIFNFASPASPPAYQADPIGTLFTNIQGAKNLLDLATRNHAVIVQASTSEVYGDPTVSPQRETYLGNVNTVGPRACYDEGKRCAETLFFDYARLYGTRIKVGRIFNTYGPRMRPDDGRVVSNFIVQALTNAPITVYGSGRQTRSFCFVDDLVDGFIRLLHAPDDATGPINLGNPAEFTVLELAERVIQMTNSKSRIVHAPPAIDDPQQRRPDISQAGALLDWRPHRNLDDGLVLTVAYFEKALRHQAMVN
jgi:UDP-glucuronate decarboxylase